MKLSWQFPKGVVIEIVDEIFARFLNGRRSLRCGRTIGFGSRRTALGTAREYGEEDECAKGDFQCVHGVAPLVVIPTHSIVFVGHEGHLQKPYQCLPVLRVKAVKSVTQGSKICFRCVGAKYSIPKGKDIGVIRVGLLL